MAKAPASYTDKTLIFKVRLLAALSFRLLGFGFKDIQIASAVHGPFNRFNGMFLSDIAKARQVIHKMTGASARRFNITDRGILKEGKAFGYQHSRLGQGSGQHHPGKHRPQTLGCGIGFHQRGTGG